MALQRLRSLTLNPCCHCPSPLFPSSASSTSSTAPSWRSNQDTWPSLRDASDPEPTLGPDRNKQKIQTVSVVAGQTYEILTASENGFFQSQRSISNQQLPRICFDEQLSPCSTRIAHRTSRQESRGRCRAEGAGWPRTPPLLPSAAWWPSPCPSHPCSRQSERAACRRRTGTYPCHKHKTSKFYIQLYL